MSGDRGQPDFYDEDEIASLRRELRDINSSAAEARRKRGGRGIHPRVAASKGLSPKDCAANEDSP